MDVNLRIDCHPGWFANDKECKSRKCCWNVVQNNYPGCFFPDDTHFYHISEINAFNMKNTFYIYHAKLNDGLSNHANINQITLNISVVNENILRWQIKDRWNKRWEIDIFNDNLNKLYEKGKTFNDFNGEIDLNANLIKLNVTKWDMNIFNSFEPLIYADQFIQFSIKINYNDWRMYGLGENYNLLQLNQKNKFIRRNLWNHDDVPMANNNLYGSHPFIIIAVKNRFFGYFLQNSNEIEIDISSNLITFRILGGIVDVFIFSPSASLTDVLHQYFSIIGKPMIPPIWSLNYHLSRYGYGNDYAFTKVIERNDQKGIKIKTYWLDIDYMNQKRDFTLSEKFKRLPMIIKKLHMMKKKIVIILDPGIYVDENYFPYVKGLEYQIFIKNSTNDNIIGKVWPGNVVYPDFTHTNVTKWWRSMINTFQTVVPFDGLWIDMNELANFVDGSIYGCTINRYDNPQYIPHIMGHKLNYRTICMSSKYYKGIEYNIHNLYAYYEAKTTFKVMTEQSKLKPFILTRSSFSGIGKYSALWSGDNQSKWDDLRRSIPHAIRSQMFGVSMTGSDICGFLGNATPELCLRWTQVGIFYTFMRNHNSINSRDQDPATFDDDYVELFKKSINLRTRLIPYIYSSLIKMNKKSVPVIRSLFHDYSNDNQVYDINFQFMFGSHLLVSPYIYPQSQEYKIYIPKGQFYQYDTNDLQVYHEGVYQYLNNSLDYIDMKVLAGSILMILEDHQWKLNTWDIEMQIYCDENYNAYTVYNWQNDYICDEDGVNCDEVEIIVEKEENTIKITKNGNTTSKTPFLKSIQLVDQCIKSKNKNLISVTLDGKEIKYQLTENRPMKIIFDWKFTLSEHLIKLNFN